MQVILDYLEFSIEDVVYEVFSQLNNDRDIAELIRAFGMRNRNVALIGTGKKGLTAFINTEKLEHTLLLQSCMLPTRKRTSTCLSSS